MKRSHRKTHAWLWLLLGPIIAVLFWLGLSARPELPIELQQPGADHTRTTPEQNP